MGVLAKIKKYQRVIANFFSLSLINGISHILALFTVPYLIRVLGIDNYGAYTFMYVLAQYMLLAGNYGFKFSVTRQVSVFRDDKRKISTIFNATIFARLFITLLVIILGLIFVTIFLNGDDLLMYLFAFGIVFGDIFIPTWLFQGMEEMRYLTIVNVISKFVFAVLIFIFIKQPADYVYVILLNSLGYIAAGIFSTWIAVKHFGLHFAIPRISDVKSQFKDGWHIFVSNIGMELYRNSNVFLLRVFVGETAVGIFGSIEKLVKAAQSILNALPQAFFPYVSRKFYSGNAKNNVVALERLLKWAFLLLFAVAVVFVCSPKLISIYLALDYDIVKYLVWLLAPVLLFGCLNYIIGIVGLVNMGASDKFQRNIWITAATSVTFMLLFCREYSYYAAAIAWTWAEFILFVLCYRSVWNIKHRKEVA